MKLNQKLIKDLKDGRVILYNEPKNPEAVRSVLREAFPKDFTHIQGDVSYYYADKASSGYWVTCDNLARSNKLPVTSIADFLRPEPRFKVGDLVCHVNNSNISGRVTDLSHDGERWVYTVFPYSGVFKEEKIWFASPDETTESATKTGSEQQFEIGREYEFYDGEDCVKGKVVGTVDYEGQRNFIADIGGKLSVFEDIRPIQHKEIKITRWINMSQSGNQVGKKCFESEIEARQHAPKSQNVFQVKLTGTYTI